MGVQLKPQQSFTVVRQIANHTDSGTYYVRAVIRNAYTDDLIATLDLTSRGSQRFSKNWQVPADSSGQGFYISIVTSVYTDSGYTTKSENYGDEENTHLVAELWPHGRGGGGVDYFTIRRIVKEEIEKIPKPEPVIIPEFPKIEMRWEDVLGKIDEVKKKIKPQEKVDFSEVMELMHKTMKAVEDKEVTPATELTPVIEKIDDLLEEVRLNHSESMGDMEEKMSTFNENLPKLIGQNTVKALETAKLNIAMNFKPEEKPKEKLPSIDIRSLL